MQLLHIGALNYSERTYLPSDTAMTYVHDTLEGLRKSALPRASSIRRAEEVLECLRPLLETVARATTSTASSSASSEPERQICSVSVGVDDAGKVQVNKGLSRPVQFGPGSPTRCGLRFPTPASTHSIIKVPGLRADTFKNALTVGCPSAGGRAAPTSTQGQVRRRNHAFLPVVHERAVSPYRRDHRCYRPATSA